MDVVNTVSNSHGMWTTLAPVVHSSNDIIIVKGKGNACNYIPGLTLSDTSIKQESIEPQETTNHYFTMLRLETI